MSDDNNHPSRTLARISVIIPTLNAEAILENCLASLARQNYPRESIEIILADAHSKDRTRDIAKKYGARVLDDDGKNMEEGKRLALQHASGEFVVFVDADNEITHADYLELAVKALAANPHALGVEGYYLPSPKMSSFCAYLTHLLHISDPISWLMSANPQLIARDGETERWTLPGGSLSYPLGANGFVFRRADLESVRADEHFQDTHAALHLMHAGKREWLRIRGRGVHHYYVQTLWGFVQKRRRATVHFLRVQEETGTNWMEEKPPVPLWLAAVYCVTFIGPLWHTLRGLVRDRDLCWFWHTPACLGSVLGNAWGVLTYKHRGKDKTLIAELQVKQTLKSGGLTMSRTLIVYLHGIGDNIMLTGVLREYCRQRPEERIDLVVLNPGCAAIWKNNPLVNSVMVYPGSQPYFWNPVRFYLWQQWKVRRYIRELNGDSRYQRVLFPTIQTLPEIIYHLTGAYGRHKIERLSHDMGVPPKLYPYDLHTSADDAAEAGKLLQKFSGLRLAVLHPFSGHAKKRISNDGFGKILKSLGERGLATLVVGAPDEKSRFDPDWKTESAFGLSFGVLTEVLKRAEIFAGTDSAVAHLAAFANTPRIVILSPKLEPRRYLPVSEHGRISLIHIRQNREPENLAEFSALLAAR